MTPVDEWAVCAQELLSVHEATRGSKPQIVLIGKKKYRGIVSAIDTQNIPDDGGWDFGGAYTVQIPLASFGREGIPEQNAETSFAGIHMRVYSTSTINAMVEVVIANRTQ